MYEGKEHDEPIYECELQGIDVDLAGTGIVEIEGLDEQELMRREIYDGGYMLQVDGAVFENGVMKIPPNAELDFQPAPPRGPNYHGYGGRHLMPTKDYIVLVIHVVANDTMTTSSPEQLSNDIFGITGSIGPDNVNLKYNMENCSYSQVTITPASGGNITDGVVSVNITENAIGGTRVGIRNAAMDAAKKMVLDSGETSFKSKFDLVMVCTPPGTKVNANGGGWVAFGKCFNYFIIVRCSCLAAWCKKKKVFFSLARRPYLAMLTSRLTFILLFFFHNVCSRGVLERV